MITIYQADSAEVRKYTKLEQLLQRLPKNMHERAHRYKFEKDAFNFVVGRLLLQKGLNELGINAKIEHIAFQESGKPFLKNIFFNISHTENLVVCALSTKGEIGIDVEKEKQIVLEDFKPWFTIGELSDIISSDSPIRKFYWYWTRKESIIKAMGVKLSYLHRIEIDSTKNHFLENGRKWFLKDLVFDHNITGAICSETSKNDEVNCIIKNVNDF